MCELKTSAKAQCIGSRWIPSSSRILSNSTMRAFCSNASDAYLGHACRLSNAGELRTLVHFCSRNASSRKTRRKPVANGVQETFRSNLNSISSDSWTDLNCGVSASLQPRNKKLSLNDLIAPVSEDLQALNDSLQSLICSENPLLLAASEQIFSAGGKRMRPAIVFLVARATTQLARQDITSQHRRLAQVTEMIHTASLIHDDVLDESEVRRGKQTVHQLYGTRIAVLAGDFMFAQSSWYLANLDNLEVIKLISQVIKDFASGEIKQASSLFDCDTTLQEYLDKSYFKTASLIAASARSAAIFSGVEAQVRDNMFDYGKHLGLAFQIIDDILDFTQSTEQLGKPAGSDLAKGNLTAPVLFALEQEPELRELIDTEFTDEGSLQKAILLVTKAGGVERAMELAKQEAAIAMQALDCLPAGPAKSSLEKMVHYVLERAS